MTTSPLVVDIYTRVSLDRTGEMLAVERQEAECRAYCERQGWTVRHHFSDNDISATSGKVRPDFEQLLQSGTQGIVVWHTDRLVRLSSELLRVIELGVPVFALHAGHLDLATPAGRAVAKTVTAWAEYEGEQKALRQKASHTQRAKAGKPWWPHRPFGYERDTTIRESEATPLRRGYKDFVAKKATLTEIARRWNADGLVTTSGNPWTQSKVRQLFINPRNAGIRCHNGLEVGPGAWDGIVPEEIFRATLVVLADPTRARGGGGFRKGMLTGIAVCGECGSTVRQAPDGNPLPDGSRRTFYKCPNFCVHQPTSEVDEFVGEMLVAQISDPKYVGMLLAPQEQSGDLMAEREALAVNMTALGEDYADGLVTRDEFRRLRLRQQERLVELDAQINQALDRTVLSDLPRLDVLAEGWFKDDAVPVVVKRRAINAFVTVTLQRRGRGYRGYDPTQHIKLDWVGSVPA